MKYRDHLELLEDSMKTAVELPALLSALRNHIGEAVYVEPYEDDPDTRIGWARTCAVISDTDGIVGFTDELPVDDSRSFNSEGR